MQKFGSVEKNANQIKVEANISSIQLGHIVPLSLRVQSEEIISQI